MILALHNNALYSELELRELYSIYKDKGAAGLSFEQFIAGRFFKHPYFTEAKYLWRADYEKALRDLREREEEVTSSSQRTHYKQPA